MQEGSHHRLTSVDGRGGWESMFKEQSGDPKVLSDPKSLKGFDSIQPHLTTQMQRAAFPLFLAAPESGTAPSTQQIPRLQKGLEQGAS